MLFAACQAAASRAWSSVSERRRRMSCGWLLGTEPRHPDDDIAVLHHDGNVVRLPQGERPLCPQSDLFSPPADERPRLSLVMSHKRKPASFGLFPVSFYVVIPGAGSFLPTLFGLLNTICRCHESYSIPAGTPLWLPTSIQPAIGPSVPGKCGGAAWRSRGALVGGFGGNQ